MNKREIMALADEYCLYLKKRNLKITQAKDLEKRLIPVFNNVLAHSMVDCITQGKTGEYAYNLALSNAGKQDKKTITKMSVFMVQMIVNGTVKENVLLNR